MALEFKREPVLFGAPKQWVGPMKKYIVNPGHNLNHNTHKAGDIVELHSDEAESIMEFDSDIISAFEEKPKALKQKDA